ncbi:Rtr1/RPAP2 family-domain-containing protein [Glomus cerebriforme]|uniref:RNA polymerase II subunit B1 CTD phosphatase RPAP2 homolog n=1 Tax=Glomus cerebriforme TaxID=658196 RepID=A0A397TH58_9GLOM|nr:Rtr1/RPAP2 family-domain-containing protein [Glomus cerebriforme]
MSSSLEQKSLRKPKRKTNNDSGVQRRKPNKLTTKQKLVKQSLETRKKFEQLSLVWQEKLFEPINIDILRESAKYLLPQHYFEIVEERNADNLCGYPICNKERQKIQGQFRISNRSRKIYDVTELKCYCSTVCFTSSKFFATQLSEEPIYMRKLENWKAVNVIPLGVDLREIIKKENSVRKSQNKEDIKSHYVKEMLANLPPAPPGLIIKEKDDKEIEVPSAPTSTNDANAHDAIEGFRINFQKLSISDIDNKPSTLVLSKEKQIIEDNAPKTPKTDEEAYEMAMSLANSMFRNGKFHYKDSEENENVPVNIISESTSVKTTDLMKKIRKNEELSSKQLFQSTFIENKGPSDDYSSKSFQPTNDADTSLRSPPEKQARKKKRVVLEMSLFGKIWTAIDRMSTSNTRQYFKSINRQFKNANGPTIWRKPITDENMLMRIQIFSEKIIECFHILRKPLAITTSIERELIDLMSTFTFDTTTVVLNDRENNVLCMVFLYALSMDIPELYRDIFPEKSPDAECQFKTVLESMNLTMEELNVFIKVLRVGPV